MKRILVIISALALSTGVSYAMEEGAEEEMMMEAPAPSVTLGGSAKMGLKNVSGDGTDSKISLIREYEVSFASSGTTDGGLMFGAGISIDEKKDDDAGNDVASGSVYVGGAGGAWKLKFGDGVDPGIYHAGGIGVAEEDNLFSAINGHGIELSGNFEGASYVITTNAPSGDDVSNEWSAGVKYQVGDFGIGVGLDSSKGLAIGLDSEFSGVTTSVFYGTGESGTMDGTAGSVSVVHKDDEDMTAVTEVPFGSEKEDYILTSVDQMSAYSKKPKGFGAKASMSAGEGVTLSVAYSTNKVQKIAVASDLDKQTGNLTISAKTAGAGDVVTAVDPLPAIAFTEETPTLVLHLGSNYQDDGSALIADATAIDKSKFVIYEADPDKYVVAVGRDGAITDVFDATSLQVDSDGSVSYGTEIAFTAVTQANADTYARPATPGTPGVALGDVLEAEDTETIEGDFAGAGLRDDEFKKLELDLSYNLGGGATFNAGIDQLDSNGSKETTIEASISMSF